ncbi:hypothetical protein B296_00052059, partial [Ensete ventricosum]
AALASTATGRGFLLASTAASSSGGTIRRARLSIALRSTNDPYAASPSRRQLIEPQQTENFQRLCQFLNILYAIPFVVVDSGREADQVKELIETARECLLGLKMEVYRKEIKDNSVRQQELATVSFRRFL